MSEETKETKETKENKEIMEVIEKDGKKAVKMNIHHPDFLKPQRLEGESDYQYKARRMIGNLYTKNKKKGQLIWISKDIHQPVLENPEDKNSKIIGYTETKGFTYNKKQVQAAVDTYIKQQKEQELLRELKNNQSK